MKTGNAIYRFLTGLDPELKIGKGFSVIYPYGQEEVRRVLKLFCSTFYSNQKSRTLILGINPGRFGAGITGIPFTDPVALRDHCGIDHALGLRGELSSTFIYEFINRFGGPKVFYDSYLISSVMPLGLMMGSKNCNYYDSPALVKKSTDLIHMTMKQHLKMGVNRNRVIILGKKNASFFTRFDGFAELFKEVVILEHPRYIMQYKLKNKQQYLDQWLSVLGR